jgi:hypothetical protein
VTYVDSMNQFTNPRPWFFIFLFVAALIGVGYGLVTDSQIFSATAGIFAAFFGLTIWLQCLQNEFHSIIAKEQLDGITEAGLPDEQGICQQPSHITRHDMTR